MGKGIFNNWAYSIGNSYEKKWNLTPYFTLSSVWTDLNVKIVDINVKSKI